MSGESPCVLCGNDPTVLCFECGRAVCYSCAINVKGVLYCNCIKKRLEVERYALSRSI